MNITLPIEPYVTVIADRLDSLGCGFVAHALRCLPEDAEREHHLVSLAEAEVSKLAEHASTSIGLYGRLAALGDETAEIEGGLLQRKALGLRSLGPVMAALAEVCRSRVAQTKATTPSAQLEAFIATNAKIQGLREALGVAGLSVPA